MIFISCFVGGEKGAFGSAGSRVPSPTTGLALT